LETIRRFQPHTLSEAEEKIINIKNITGQSAVNQLYDIVTNGFTFTMRVGGKKQTMNRETLTAFLRSPKAALRESAYREMYRLYESHQDLLGEPRIFNCAVFPARWPLETSATIFPIRPWRRCFPSA
jgi:oligoendopeptidase F